MTEQPRDIFLRKLTRGGKPEPEFGVITPAKALRLALAKAGQDVLTQVLDGSGVEELRLPLAKVPEALPEGALTTLLFGPNEARGLVCLDKVSVSAITEGLTTGCISSTSGVDRTPTAVDAMLCQRFLLTFLTVLAAKLVDHPAAEWVTGFVPEEHVPDLRRLPLLMEDEMYRIITVDTDFAGGAKTGQMLLVLPWDGRHKAHGQIQDIEVSENDDVAWSKSLEKAVMPVEAELQAVLHKVSMSLDDVSKLQPGDMIPVPVRAVTATALEDLDGHVVARVRLGQSQGFRAVKFEHPPSFEDLSPTTDLDQAAEDTPPETFSLSDAMASAPGLAGPSASPAMADIDSVDASDDFAVDGLDMGSGDLPDLPDLSVADDADGELPPLDLGDLPMTDLDDLPMTIE